MYDKGARKNQSHQWRESSRSLMWNDGLHQGKIWRRKDKWVGSGWFQNYSRHESGLEIVCEGEKVKKNRDLGFQPKWLGGFWCHFLKCKDCIWILLWMINVFHPEQTLSFSARSMDRDNAGCFILLTASPAAPGALYRHRREPICTLARISRQICYASVFQDTLL